MKQGTKNVHITGKLRVNSGGFGFVLTEQGDDLFIPRDNMQTALNGDTVEAVVVRTIPGRNPVARIISVVERKEHILVGMFRASRDGGGSVAPEDDRLKVSIQIPANRVAPKSERTRPPKHGEVVAVKLVSWSSSEKHPVGQVLEVLGSAKDTNIDLKIVARSKGFPLEFPREVEDEAGSLREAKIRKEKKHREDLRNLVSLTIDPENAKDFDDALSIRQLENGLYEVGVHIADVSWYVREGNPIDREAAKRGTSVYLVQHVIPMLPERLSNDLCSLRPGEDRLAFSVMLTLTSRGEVVKYRIVETVIRSSGRLTYEDAQEILAGKPHRFAREVHNLMMLGTVLRRNREEEGSIDFDISEPVLSLDEYGVPYEVRPKERLDAHRLVEEFMLLANRTVAGFMMKQQRRHLPFIYRVHDRPKEEDIHAFLKLLEGLGIHYNISGELQSEDYRKILDIIENLDFKDFIEKVALRSMTKASYSTENRGHFGLACDAYTHFTSPIRRYPDLLVHRLLKSYARKAKDQDAAVKKGELERICANAFQREVLAVQAEREYIRIKAMQFLAGKVGGVYDGVISGVTSFGIFVELSGYLIEGLVHISEMTDDRYRYDKELYQLQGEQNGTVYRLGDPVKVHIASVSVEERKADFLLA